MQNPDLTCEAIEKGLLYQNDVKFSDVMGNKRKFPLTKQEFFLYLKGQLCEENLEFLDEVEKFKCNPDKEAACYVMSTFIREKAPKELTLSHSVKAKIESALLSGQIDSGLMSPAESEVLRILQLNKFPQFVLQAKQNTNANSRRTRLKLGIGAMIIAAFISICLILEAWGTIHTNRTTSPFRLIAYPVFCISYALLISVKTGICTFLMFTRKRMKPEETNSIRSMIDGGIPIEDPEIRAIIRRKGTIHICIAITCATFTMLLILAVPPYKF
eukprot:Phypoly_transcript_07857.p1 GENE.Phypoly_transcript_07857~~Phypoly_transcript_07857.p1  ORF type:complete len:272 (+),score=16.73 Phypoly_transcript_07857:654-1469(+)